MQCLCDVSCDSVIFQSYAIDKISLQHNLSGILNTTFHDILSLRKTQYTFDQQYKTAKF